MALISCPECNRHVSESATACPECGFPVAASLTGPKPSTVSVYGYTQQFAVNPPVRVSWNGAVVGAVKKGEALTFEIDSAGVLSFKCGFRRASLNIPFGTTTKVKLSWDRLTGRLIPQVVDTVVPGH